MHASKGLNAVNKLFEKGARTESRRTDAPFTERAEQDAPLPAYLACMALLANGRLREVENA